MTENIKFKDLGLSEEVLEAISRKGFEEPSPIQAQTIPVMLKNDRNIIAQAQTGTGKTAAFGLPLLDLINHHDKSVQALILAPTRELAIQVSEEINSLKGNSGISVIPVYGGQSIDQQLRRLKRGVHIIVGTPGRVIDHLKRKTINLRDIEHLVLDEADEMLNMGFIDDLEEIMKYTNPDKKTLLFSATMPQRIKDLAKKYMGEYEFITVKKQQLTTNLTEQIYYEVKMHDKFEALCRIIDIEENFYAVVFCRTKNGVDDVTSHLADRGYDVDAIHGDITQSQREKTLAKFKSKKINILVATDVAARGIDINNLTHVINYSLPQDPESYVHRIGRTGRAGKQGTAITFITPSEYRKLMFIQRVAKTDIKKQTVPDIKDILVSKRNKINEDIAKIDIEKVNNTYFNWAKSLLENNNPTEVLASLLYNNYDEELNPATYKKINSPSSYRDGGRDRDRDRGRDNRRDGGRDRGRGRIQMEGKARLFIAKGKKDSYNMKKLIELIQSKVNVNPRQINDVSIMDNFSFATVPFEIAEEIVMKFKDRGQKPIITHAKSR